MTKIPGRIREATHEFPEWSPTNGTKVDIYGTEGRMLVGRVGGGWQSFLGEKGELGPSDKQPHREMQVAHVADFVECLRSRKAPVCDIQEGHVTAELVHMASISYRVGNRKLVFDPETETFGDDAEANALLKRAAYREPWVIPQQI